MNLEEFKKFSDIVVDQLEGGYYHPKMFYSLDDPRYLKSGETMYGIDRKNAPNLVNTPAGEEFWRLVDANKSKWRWNDKGGELEPELKVLVARIMLPWYTNLTRRYLNKEAQEKINQDDRLKLHFVYAAWNGSGWFQKFANDINKISGESVGSLVNQAINSRTREGLKPGSPANSLIKQTGVKLAKIFADVSTGTKPNFLPVLIVAGLLILITNR